MSTGTSTCVSSRLTAASTPGAREARSADPVGSPAGPVTTWSAVMPSRSCSEAISLSLVCMKTSVEAKAIASTIGVIAEANRRALVRELAAASTAEAPPPRSSRPKSAAHSRATSGPSRATASMKSMMTPREALAALSPAEEEATPAKTAPPTRAPSPRTVRMTPGRNRSTEASMSACPGLIFAGLRPAIKPEPSAASSPVPTAASSGIHETCRSTASGMAPRSFSCPNHQRASAIPGRHPTSPASGATSSASAATARRICRGVAPTARSSANSRVRWPTDRATVAGRGEDGDQGGDPAELAAESEERLLGVRQAPLFGFTTVVAGVHLRAGAA